MRQLASSVQSVLKRARQAMTSDVSAQHRSDRSDRRPIELDAARLNRLHNTLSRHKNRVSLSLSLS